MDNKDLKKTSALGEVSLVLGIISILSALFWYITIPTSVLAIIFGKKAVNKFASKLGKAGLITGIIGISLFAFIYLLLITFIIFEQYL